MVGVFKNYRIGKLRQALILMPIVLPFAAAAQGAGGAATVADPQPPVDRSPAVPPSGDPSPNVPERAPASFPIYAIDVSGVTILAADELERIVYKFTGPDRSNVDVEAARQAIQDAYTAKGYESVLVESPLQQREQFLAGVISIAVNESPIAKVTVTGSRYHSDRVLRNQLPSIAEGKPLNFKSLQTEFAAVGRFPDRTVDFNPKPGATPGTIDVELVVKDKFPLHSSFELNNDNSPLTTPLRLSGNTRYTDVWRLGHTINFGFVMAPQRLDDSTVVTGSYVAPILGTPWTLSLRGYRSNSAVAALGGTRSLGNGYQVGVRADYVLPSKDGRQTVGAQLDYKDFLQDVQFGGFSVGDAPIKYIPLTLDYSVFAADSDSAFAKKVGTSTFGISISTTLGLGIIKRQLCIDQTNSLLVPKSRCGPTIANPLLNDQFSIATRGGSENFVRFGANFNYSLATASDWLFTTVWGLQVANQHLVANEQYGLGGRDTIRGYFQSEATGDTGFNASFDITAPSLAPVLGKWVDELRAYAFVDTGFVRTLGTVPGETRDVQLFSVGGGARVKLFDRISGELIVGVPLIDSAQTLSDRLKGQQPVSKKGDPRTVFVVRGEF